MSGAGWEEVRSDEAWDAAALAFDDVSVFQSAAWADHRRASGWLPERWSAGRAAIQILVREVLGTTVAWAPGGPLVGGGASEPLADLFEELFRRLSLRHRRLYARVDAPGASGSAAALALAHGWSRPRARMNSGLTVMLDLTSDRDRLVAGLSEHHRRELRRAAREAMTWTSGRGPAEVDALVGLHAQMTARKRIATAPQATAAAISSLCSRFGDRAIVLVGSRDGVPVTACFALTFGDRSFFHTAATGSAGLRRAASYAAVVELALELARRDIRLLDLGGLDESASMAGVAAFKKGFGGRVVERTGEWHRAAPGLLAPVVDAAIALRRGPLGV